MLGDFIDKYTREEIDIEKSVEKDIDDLGRTVYSDSVMIKRNILLDRFGYIEREDSNYVMVIPTPEVWKEKYDSIKNSLNTDSYSVTHLTFRRREPTLCSISGDSRLL